MLKAAYAKWHGPRSWAVSAAGGGLVGWLVSRGVPAQWNADGVTPVVGAWLVAPFVALLASIAVMPFLAHRFWHRHYPDLSLALGGLVAGYFLGAFAAPGYRHAWSYGSYAMWHAVMEYYSFIALVGGLFLISGGIVVEVRGRGGPVLNTLLLAAGAVLANLIGTTGASVLLIRPFIRANAGRLAPMHVVFFIFIVSNCGGSLTPIGDPPLYLGYLKGVPFFWTVEHLWSDWLLVNALLLATFLAYDAHVGRRQRIAGVHPHASGHQRERFAVSLRGIVAMAGLGLLVAGVFIPKLVDRFAPEWSAWPIGPTFQLGVAAACLALSPKENFRLNGFTLEPIKEVGLLFAGIFVTMVPALAYLSVHGNELGLSSASSFYLGTGSLSAVLDNAPTYLNFLQIAVGREIDPPAISAFLGTEHGRMLLHAISNAAVFFGAMTYIGNGPNFMVKAIAEGEGVRMPSFLGYVLRALLVLTPILGVHWLVFVR
ncbi:MAG: sodium:proton antiporter [Planctomycetota bacterium]